MKKINIRLLAWILSGFILFEGFGLQTYATEIQEIVEETETESAKELLEKYETETESVKESGLETESDFMNVAETESEEEKEEESLPEPIFVLESVKNLKAKSAGLKKIFVEWESVEGADGYIVKRQIGKSTFETVAEVEETSYLDTDASNEEYNFYRIYPYYIKDGEKITGPSDKYVYAKASLNAVKNLKVSSTGKERVTLKWESVEGADGYLIYRQIGKTKFQYLYMTGNKTFSDLKASATEYNFYRVYPYYMKDGQMIAGPSDAYVYGKGVLSMKAVQNLKAVTKAQSHIHLTWTKAQNAEGYLIYRQVGNTTFEFIAETTALSYSDYNAAAEEYNFYRVYPYYMSGEVRIVGPSDKYVYAKGMLPEGWMKKDSAWMYYEDGKVIYKFSHLREVFDWSSKEITYKVTLEPPAGVSHLEWYSDYGFTNKYGNCYVMASTFAYVARLMGYEAYLVEGVVPLARGGVGPHGWVEIVVDGTVYVCDPDFTYETGRNGYFITYGTSGTWRYMNYNRVD